MRPGVGTSRSPRPMSECNKGEPYRWRAYGNKFVPNGDGTFRVEKIDGYGCPVHEYHDD